VRGRRLTPPEFLAPVKTPALWPPGEHPHSMTSLIG
jgi:hypothetical protein